MTTKAWGAAGFRWFIGVVEDREDPEKAGRVRVRVYGVHEQDKVLVPTEALPWAPVLMPGTSASLNGIGISATGLLVGSTVVGFFLDGNETTMPVVFGVLPGVTDMPGLAAGKSIINKERLGLEPESAYRAQYPYNKVVTTESGHVFEIDDTPNFERIHTFHRSGTYQEIDVDGTRVNKIVGEDFEIVQKNKTLYVQGSLNIVVKGNVTITAPITTVNGNLNVNGTVTATDDVIGGGISLAQHTHPDVSSGPPE
jgi:hypothetical protein